MSFHPAYSAAVFFVLATAVLGIGSLCGRAISLRASGGERLWWEAAIGYVAATLLLGFVGVLGLLDSRAIVIVTLILAAVGVVRCVRWIRDRDSNPATCSGGSSRSEPPVWPSRLLTIAAGIAVTASFLGSLAPPTAGDALCYHLELPKRFLQEGRIDFRLDDDNNTYPLATELGFLWALAFDAPAAAATTQWGLGLLTAAAAYLLARPYCGPSWGRAAACVVVLTPGVNNQMTAPLNDVAAAALCAFGLAAWDAARRSGNRGDYLLLGIFVGGALGVKYNAILFAAAIGAALFLEALQEKAQRRVIVRGATIAVVVAALVGGLWYGRAAWYRGDPVYPFLSKHETAAAPSGFSETKTPLGRGPLAVVEAPWSMTMSPERFGGRGHQLGPLFLMFVPAAAAIGSTRAARSLVVATIVYLLGCVVLRQNVRFLFPAIPALAVFVVLAWREMASWSGWPRALACAAAAIVVLFQIAVPAARLRHTAAVVVGAQSGEAFLAEREPTYAPADWMNEHLAPEAAVLSQEHRAFYIDAPITRENIFRRRTSYDQLVGGRVDLSLVMRLAGFTHLLTAEGRGSHGDAYDATLSRLVDAAVAQAGPHAPILLNHWQHRDDDGVERSYRLFALP